MRRLIIGLLFLLVSVWGGLQVVRHPGDLFIVLPPWTIQMPLWFALLASLFIFLIFYIFINGIDKLQFLWCRLKMWLRFRSEHQSYSKTQQGLAMLIEERWHKAERLLLSGVNQSIEPLMNYLGAAKAAQAQGAYERRNSYIQKAYEVAPTASLAIGLTQAELELSDNQAEQAAGTLTRLRQKSPRHPRVLSLLEKAYVRLGDWKNLETLLSPMRKAKVLTQEHMEIFEKNLYGEILQNSCNELASLHASFRAIPNHMKKNAQVILVYINCLLSLNLPEETTTEIEALIRKTMKNQWDKEHKDLMIIYSALNFTSINRQLVIVGAWLKYHGAQPEILFALGRLCMRQQLWGKAKDYFEKSFAIQPNPIISLEYGRLLEHLGEPVAAMEKYREGLIEFEHKQSSKFTMKGCYNNGNEKRG